MGIPYGLTPYFCLGTPLCLGFIWFGAVASVDISPCLVKWGYASNFSFEQQESLFNWVGSIPHQGRWWWVIKKLDMEGYLPIPCPLWSCNCDLVPWVVMAVVQSAGLMVSTVLKMSIPLTKCMQSCRTSTSTTHYLKFFTHLWWTLWQWMSTGEVITSHWSTPGKSCWPDVGWSPDHYLLMA